MNTLPRVGVALAVVLAATAAPRAALAQASDWQSVASGCVATSASASQQVTVASNGSFIRAKLAAGPNPPTLNYVCNVLDPSNVTVPIWTKLRLEYLDTLGGLATATLYAKSKTSGGIVNLGNVISAGGAGVTTATVGVPPLDFAANSYYVLLGLQPSPATQPQLHAVTLAE